MDAYRRYYGELFHIESKEFETVTLNQVYMFSGENSHARSYGFQYFWDDVKDDDKYREEYIQKVQSTKRILLIKLMTSKCIPEVYLNSVDDFDDVGIDKETQDLIVKTSSAGIFGTNFLNYIRYCMKVGSVNHWYDVAFELIEEISNMNHEYALSNRRMLLKKLILSMKTEFVVDFLSKNVGFQIDEIATKDTAITEDKLLEMARDLIDKEFCERGCHHLTYKDIKEELLKKTTRQFLMNTKRRFLRCCR